MHLLQAGGDGIRLLASIVLVSFVHEGEAFALLRLLYLFKLRSSTIITFKNLFVQKLLNESRRYLNALIIQLLTLPKLREFEFRKWFSNFILSLFQVKFQLPICHFLLS